MSEPSSIDDIVNAPTQMAGQSTNNQNPNHMPVKQQNHDLEHKVDEHKDDGGWNFKQIGKDLLKFSPFMIGNFLLSGGLGFLAGTKTFWQASSSLASPLGYLGGRFIENKKNKKKTTWYEARKELGTGSFIGCIAYTLYKAPEYLVGALGIPTATWYGKILKTMMFNPLMFIPFFPIYHTMTYLRDKIGTRKSLKGLVNGKIFGYLKESYKPMKEDFKKSVPKTSALLFPSHYLTIGQGLVTEPAYRVGIGAVHDVVFRLVSGKKKEETGEHKEKISIGQKVKSFYKSIPNKIDNFFKVPGYELNHGTNSNAAYTH